MQYLRKVEKSQTLLLNEQSRNLEQQGKQVYKFGFGQSPFLPPQNVIDALKTHAARKDYSPVQGIPALRAAVAAFHRAADGIDVQADNVLIAPGSKILIYAVMAAFTKADVLVPVPSWVSYIPQAQLVGHSVIKIQTSFRQRWRLTPALLDAALSGRKDKKIPSILILNYPGNPDGLTYTADELKSLAEVLKKHGTIVVSDEIYGLLHHEGRHVSLAKFYPEGTIITTGLSKWCGAGGWRLGVAILPAALGGEFRETMLGIASETYSCASLPVQLAACEAYQWDDATKKYIAQQRRILSALGEACFERLDKAGVGVFKPEGGFYMFLDFSPMRDALAEQGIHGSQALCERLLKEKGVALLPGTAFGMEPEHLSARLAYVDFNGVAVMAAAEKASSVDAHFISENCRFALDGLDGLCAWASVPAVAA